MAKNASKIKNKSPKKELKTQRASPVPVESRVKTFAKELAKAVSEKARVVKAMAAKPTKKPKSKAAPKAMKSEKAHKAEKRAKHEKLRTAPKAEKLGKAGKIEKPSKELKNPKSGAPEAPEGKKKPDAGKGLTKEQAIIAAVLAAEKAAQKAEGKGKAGAKGKGGAKALAAAAHHEKMCRESGCENLATTKGYCRLDYIKNWKKIKRKEMILKEGKLNQYIEELVSKYPDKYIEVIRQDLATEVNFNKVIHDLELDESMDDLDYDGDSIDSLIGSIRKEDDDFGGSEF